MTNYERGVRWERDLQRLLIRKGWKVLRSAGSHQAIDLIAGRFTFNTYDPSKSWRALAIQCKSGKARWTDGDKAATLAMAHHFHATPILAERRGRKRTYWILDETNDSVIEEAFFK